MSRQSSGVPLCPKYIGVDVKTEKEKTMYQGTSEPVVLAGYEGKAPKTVAPETIPSQIETLAKQAEQLKQMCGIAADNLTGPIPASDNCKAPTCSTVQDRLRDIGYELEEAIANQQRVLRSLAL